MASYLPIAIFGLAFCNLILVAAFSTVAEMIAAPRQLSDKASIGWGIAVTALIDLALFWITSPYLR